MRIAIGSAQFGLDYGVSNASGITPREEVARILDIAANAGVALIDTAPAYGEAEQILGELLPAEHCFSIVTKVPAIPMSCDHAGRMVRATLERSLARLQIPIVYGLLVHRAEDLLGAVGGEIFAEMRRLKEEGKIAKIGVSVYDPEQLDSIVDRYPVDLVQVPLNVIDQRLLRGGQLKRTKHAGVEIHARSVFLQGLLTMRSGAIPEYLAPVRAVIESYRIWANGHGLDPIAAAIGFVAGIPEIDVAILGVESAAQLQAILPAARVPLESEMYRRFAIADPALINPTNWPSSCVRSV